MISLKKKKLSELSLVRALKMVDLVSLFALLCKLLCCSYENISHYDLQHFSRDTVQKCSIRNAINSRDDCFLHASKLLLYKTAPRKRSRKCMTSFSNQSLESNGGGLKYKKCRAYRPSYTLPQPLRGGIGDILVEP